MGDKAPGPLEGARAGVPGMDWLDGNGTRLSLLPTESFELWGCSNGSFVRFAAEMVAPVTVCLVRSGDEFALLDEGR
jgi:hypothetical protein